MIECAMAYRTRNLDSDSASLGSNPSPPAIETQAISALTGDRQIGPDGTERARRPHDTRHSLSAASNPLIIAEAKPGIEAAERERIVQLVLTFGKNASDHLDRELCEDLVDAIRALKDNKP